jgi:hypothetical protein
METFIIRPQSIEKVQALKAFLKALKLDFEVKKEETEHHPTPYNPEFVAQILQGREDRKNGNTTKITLDDIWK